MLSRQHSTRQTLRDRSGSVLIEFALIAPILVSLLLGMYDLGPALLVRFKVASATQTVADIATQASTMQAADIVNFFAAGGDVMAPFSSSSLVLRISNIASDGQGGAFVYWSCGNGSLTPYTAKAAVTSTPTNTALSNLLILTSGKSGAYTTVGADTTFIMVESQYTFTAPAGFVIRTAQTLTSTAYTMPRLSTYVGPTTGASNFVPVPPSSINNSSTQSAGSITCNVGY